MAKIEQTIWSHWCVLLDVCLTSLWTIFLSGEKIAKQKSKQEHEEENLALSLRVSTHRDPKKAENSFAWNVVKSLTIKTEFLDSQFESGFLKTLFLRPFCLFKNGQFLTSFFFTFVFSTKLTVNKCSIKVCQWLDSNRGSLVSEATHIPQPVPFCLFSLFVHLCRY